MKQVRLNRAEVWIADHALPVFGVLALAIIAGAVAIFVIFLGQEKTQHQVDVLRPQVTTINRAICDKHSLTNEDRAARCAERIRVGLVNCRRAEPCRAALIAAITYPPPARGTTLEPGATEGGGAQNPSPAGQHPSPGPHPGGHHGGHKPAPESQETPSHAESPGQSGGQPSGQEPPPAAPGGGDSGAQSGASSGPDVEVCVPRVTCIEVGLPNLKGGAQ